MNNPPRITVLGADGMLGTDITAKLAAADHDVTARIWPKWDITRQEDCSKAVDGADIIINCAAYTNVDGAESEADAARDINASGIATLATAAADRGTYIVHFSTDFVYDGLKPEPYSEDDLTCPLNVYGRTKLEGDELLAASGARHCILRIAWTYGRAGPNFITKVAAEAATGQSLSVVDDQIGAPSPTTEIADLIAKIIEHQPQGLYLFAPDGPAASRFRIAEIILERLGLETELVPCKTDDFPAPARRPLNSAFNCAKIDDILELSRKPWNASLVEFLDGM